MVRYAIVEIPGDSTTDYCAFLGEEMVKIYVGSTKRKFLLHKKLLCKKISYFEKMFISNFVEAQTNEAELPEEDGDAMNLVFEWVYSEKFGAPDSQNSLTWKETIHSRIYAYKFAEKACCDRLQNYAMSSIITSYNKHNTFPSVSSIKLSYEGTRDESGLRVFMCQSLVFLLQQQKQDGKWRVEKLSEVVNSSNALANDMMMALRILGGNMIRDPKTLHKCMFHINHNKMKPCDLAADVP